MVIIGWKQCIRSGSGRDGQSLYALKSMRSLTAYELDNGMTLSDCQLEFLLELNSYQCCHHATSSNVLRHDILPRTAVGEGILAVPSGLSLSVSSSVVVGLCVVVMLTIVKQVGISVEI